MYKLVFSKTFLVLQLIIILILFYSCKNKPEYEKISSNKIKIENDSLINNIFDSFDSSNTLIILTDFTKNKMYVNNLNKINHSYYSPGSVQKILMTYKLLEDSSVLNYIYNCKGYDIFENQNFYCWNREGHKIQNLANSFKNSCNLYYYSLYKRIDFEEYKNFLVSVYFIDYLNNSSDFRNKIELPGLFKNKLEFLIGDSEKLKLSLFNINAILFFLIKNSNNERIKFILRLMNLTTMEGTAKNSNIYNSKIYGKTGTIIRDTEKYGIFLGLIEKYSNYYGLLLLCENQKSDYASKIAGQLIKKILFHL